MQEEDFNAQFINFEGTRCSGSNVRALISKIKVNNTTKQANKGDKFYVQYTGPEPEEIRVKNTYTVKVKHNNEGYVCEVIVTENEEDDSNAIQNNNVNKLSNNTEDTNEDVIKPIQR